MYTAKLSVDFPKVLPFCEYNSVRISQTIKTRYCWKDLSLLTLLLTNLLTLTER